MSLSIEIAEGWSGLAVEPREYGVPLIFKGLTGNERPRESRGRRWRILPALVLSMIVAQAVASASVIKLDPEDGDIWLAPRVEVFRDSTGELSIADVSGPSYEHRFEPLTAPDLFAHADEILWARFRVSADFREIEESTRWLLEISNYRFDALALYQAHASGLDNAGGGVVRERSVIQPRESGHNFPVFRLPAIGEEVQTYYLSLRAHATMPVPMNLRSGDNFRRHAEREAQVFGVVAGVLLSMFLFNGFIYFSLRDRIYLLYVTYIGSMLVYLHCLNGQHMALLGLEPRHGVAMMWVCLGSVSFFAFVFVKAFLDTKRATPHLHKLLSAVQAFAIGVIAFGVLGMNSVAHPMAMVTGLGVAGAGLAVGVARLTQGYRPARYFLMAWSALLLGVMTLPLKEFGLLPQVVPGELGTNLGAAAESILLSFALADRIRILRREKEELVVSRAHYRKASLTDELTGLYNLRYFKERLGWAIRQAMDADQPLSLLMMDVDDFKKFNDAHGHQAGDEVLTRLAGLMRTSARESDAPCRYGGEEFVLLLPGTSLGAALGVAERLRLEFESQLFEVGKGAGATTSISIGVAQLEPEESGDQLIQRADFALYRAKSKGKNRVEVEALA